MAHLSSIPSTVAVTPAGFFLPGFVVVVVVVAVVVPVIMTVVAVVTVGFLLQLTIARPSQSR